MKFTITCLLTFLVGLGCSIGQGLSVNRIQEVKSAVPVIEKLFQEFADKNHIPGLALGIVVDGQLVYGKGHGFTEIATSTGTSEQSMFRIASMTKSVTAMGILALRKEGKLKLDDPAWMYIPELKQVRPLTTDSPSITVRHLLTHMAGFPEDNPWGDRQLDIQDPDLIAFLKKGISFSNVPGVSYEYSNLGFALLGRIITNVSGLPYQQYIQEKIFKPLGMQHTIWEYTEAPQNQLAHGYRYEDEKWKEEELEHDGTYGAMGGLITSVEDWAKYVSFHLAAWPASSTVELGPVSRSDLREMQQPWNFSGLNVRFKYPSGRSCPMVSAYGYGLRWTKDCNERVSVGHSGGLPGFGSNWQMLPEYGIGVISFANLTYAGMSGLNTAILDTLLSLTQLKPHPIIVSQVLSQRKEALVKLLTQWQNAEQSGIFAENFFPDRSSLHRKVELDSIFAKSGEIVSVGAMIPENQLRGFFIVEGKLRKVRVYFTLSPENPALIQQLDFSLIP